MFCPIFLSTIPPYIRPVISWVVTVRAHSASALSLLHQPTEGEHWREGQWERKTLPYFSVPDRHEVSVWCEREEGGFESRRGGGFVGFGASRSYHIRRIWGGLKSLLHKTLTRFSSTLTFWNKGQSCKQRHDMQVHCTELTWCYLHRNTLKLWTLFSENLCRVTWLKSWGMQNT